MPDLALGPDGGRDGGLVGRRGNRDPFPLNNHFSTREFRGHHAQLRHEGRYVAIEGRGLAGFFRDHESAVAAAMPDPGPGPVLIKRVVEWGPVRRVGHALL